MRNINNKARFHLGKAFLGITERDEIWRTAMLAM
jgi:hypothetical protein